VGEWSVSKVPIQVRKCLIVAKYDFYLKDARAALVDFDGVTLFAKSSTEMVSIIKDHPDLDVIFFPHFSDIIPRDIFENYLCIGFHTGKLPKGRGGSPIQHQILEADYRCPVSAIQIVASLDAGPVYLQKEIDLSTGNIVEMLARLSLIVASMISTMISKIPSPVSQVGNPEVRKRIQEDDSKLVLEDLTSREIYDRIRMVDGLDYPPAFIEVGNVRLYLSSAELEEDQLKFVARIERK
jgi:methionyl-tRNA formyltransferase